MNDRVPAEVFSPGIFLKAALAKRGWSQVELSEILGRPPRVVSEIIAAKRAITPSTAKALAAALGTSAALWMNLESSYRLAQTSFEGSKVERRARLYNAFPVKEMIRRGWIEAAKDMDRLERAFCRYFSIASLDVAPTFEHAAKKQTYLGSPQTSQLAWLLRAERIARTVEVHPFSICALREAVKKLKNCLRSVEDVRRAPSILADAGVRLVVVEFLPGAKLDGACFWIDGSAPVIALSLRLDRLDNFWHTLFHEIDHILHGEGKDEPIVDDLDAESDVHETLPAQELRANREAAEMCIDKELIDDWIAHAGRPPPKREILAFAHAVGVHPGLVVGQLQHRCIIPYSFHRDLLEKVRTLVIESAVTDGFIGKR